MGTDSGLSSSEVTMGKGAMPANASPRRETGNTWLKPLIAILIWYVFNGGTVILNKYLFMETVGFRFPMSLTLLHLATGFVLSTAFIKTIPDIDLMPIQKSQYTADKLKFAVLFVSNIILGNVALKYIPVSFMQTIKSMTPFFTTLFQYLIMGTRYTNQTILSLVPVVAGVVLATAKELSFDMTGFLAAMLGCLVQATQIVYGSKLLGEGRMDPFNTVRFIFPPALFGLIPLIILHERSLLQEWLGSDKATTQSFALLAFSSTVAFCLNLATFQLLKVISGVAYSVAGNLKVVVVIFVSIAIFRNPISLVGIGGCMITVAGCTWYGLIRDKIKEVPQADGSDLETVTTSSK